MNVEIGAEAALFPEKEYINGIFVAVWDNWGWGKGGLAVNKDFKKRGSLPIYSLYAISPTLLLPSDYFQN